MADKIFTKYFENFKGLNNRTSDLTRNPEYASACTNLVMDRTLSLTGRPGFVPVSQHRDPGSSSASYIEYPAWGLYNYTSFDVATGETQEELLGVGKTLYRLKSGNMTISYGGAGTTATFSIQTNGSAWVADLQVDGVSQAGFPLNLGNTQVNSPTKTLAQLRTAINAIAGFTCTLTPSATVNGNQVNRSITAPITVNAGHTISVSTTRPTTVELFNGNLTANVFCDIVAKTATTITPAVVAPVTINVSNGDEIGVGLYDAFILGPILQTSVMSTTTFSFGYWEETFRPNIGGVQGDYATTVSNFGILLARLSTIVPGVYANGSVSAGTKDFQNISCAITNGTFYLAAANPVTLDRYTGTGTNFTNQPIRQSSLLQYDGQQMFSASLSQPPPPTLVVAAGAGMGTGVYKYLFRYKHINKQGQYLFSNDSSVLAEKTVTTTAGNNQVTLTLTSDGIGPSIGPLPPCNYAQVNGNQVGVLTITVSTMIFRVGDDCCFIDRATGLLERRVISAVTATTITISGAAVNVNNNDIISNNITYEIWRTKVNGNTYYLLTDLPMKCDGGTQNYTDAAADSTLNIAYDGPFLGTQRRDSAPVITRVISHQGALVGTGDRANPNTIYWSIPGQPGNWPAGTNNSDVNSFLSGPITAIASENNNMVIAFKKNAYYTMIGDLGSAQVIPGSSGEGDLGCEGQSSILKVRESLVFLSGKGPRAFTSEGVDAFGERLIDSFLSLLASQTNGLSIPSADTAKLVLARAVTAHDINNQRILFFVSGETGTPAAVSPYNLCPTQSSVLIYAYDYANDIFTQMSFAGSLSDTSGYNMAGGAAFYKGELYFISRFIPPGSVAIRGCLYKFSTPQNSQSFCDDANYYSFLWRPSHDTGDEPAINKEFVRIKIYRFIPASLSFLNGQSSDITITTYKNFIDTTAHFSTAQTWSSGTVATKEKVSKLRSDKMRVCLFQFSGTSSSVCPVITGYEYVVALPYRKEDILE